MSCLSGRVLNYVGVTKMNISSRIIGHNYSLVPSTQLVPFHVSSFNMSSVLRKIISSVNAPKPVGPYSQAVRAGDTVYVSGCLGLEIDTMKLVAGGAPAEAKKALENLQAVLNAADSSIANVVKSTVFLDDINDFSAVNEVYKCFFKEPFPARSCYQVGKLPLGAKVEIEVVAIAGKVTDI